MVRYTKLPTKTMMQNWILVEEHHQREYISRSCQEDYLLVEYLKNELVQEY